MASKGVNKVIIVGNLGRDPEIKYTADGKAVANIALATSESWKDQQGQKQEKTEWHRVVIFGKLAEIAGQYLTKGSQIYIEGKLKTRKWQDQQGADKYTTEIVLDPFSGVMQMLGGGNKSSGGTPQNNQNMNPNGTAKSPQEMKQPQGGQNKPSGEPDFDFDDDIPF